MAGKRKTVEMISGACTLIGALFVVSTAFWEHKKARIEAKAAKEQHSTSHSSPAAKTGPSNKSDDEGRGAQVHQSEMHSFPQGEIKATSKEDGSAAYFVLDKVAVSVEGNGVSLGPFEKNWGEVSVQGPVEVAVENRHSDAREVKVKFLSRRRLRPSQRKPIVVQPGQQRRVGFPPSFRLGSQKIRIEIE